MCMVARSARRGTGEERENRRIIKEYEKIVGRDEYGIQMIKLYVFKYVQFIVCQLYLNKAVQKQCRVHITISNSNAMPGFFLNFPHSVCIFLLS